jgi:hypothetical protein
MQANFSSTSVTRFRDPSVSTVRLFSASEALDKKGRDAQKWHKSLSLVGADGIEPPTFAL